MSDRELHVHIHPDSTVLAAIHALERSVIHLGDRLMSIASTTQAKLDQLNATLQTVTAGLTADIQALKDAIMNAGPTTPEINAALDGLITRLQPLVVLDESTPGSTEQPPPEATP